MPGTTVTVLAEVKAARWAAAFGKSVMLDYDIAAWEKVDPDPVVCAEIAAGFEAVGIMGREGAWYSEVGLTPVDAAAAKADLGSPLLVVSMHGYRFSD